MKNLIIFLLSITQVYAQQLSSPEFTSAVKEITEDFKIKNFSAIDLEEYIGAVNFNDHFTLLDAREPAEYKVSHLNNAIFIGSDDFDYDQIKNKLDPNKIIIIYCSVGYRSSKIAEKIENKGHKIYNLNGGIFEWMNRKFPVVDSSNKPTQKIHTYNKSWGNYVEYGEKVH